MPHIAAEGVNFHYVEAGEGTPLVLLGGTLGSARGDFGPQIDAYSKHWRVIAPDRRGYGQTRPPARDYPDDFYQRDARDMAALMAAQELPPAVVLGWSEGADVALCLAVLYPERVTRLVVWGGISAVTDEDIAIFEARRDVTAWPSKAREAMSAVYGDTYWQDTWHGWCDVMARLHRAGGDARLAPIERIACPVMLVHGSRDPLIRAAHPAALHRRIAGSVLREIDGAGHNPHLTRADEFNRLVLDFIGASTPDRARQRNGMT